MKESEAGISTLWQDECLQLIGRIGRTIQYLVAKNNVRQPKNLTPQLSFLFSTMRL